VKKRWILKYSLVYASSSFTKVKNFLEKSSKLIFSNYENKTYNPAFKKRFIPSFGGILSEDFRAAHLQKRGKKGSLLIQPS